MILFLCHTFSEALLNAFTILTSEIASKLAKIRMRFYWNAIRCYIVIATHLLSNPCLHEEVDLIWCRVNKRVCGWGVKIKKNERKNIHKVYAYTTLVFLILINTWFYLHISLVANILFSNHIA